MQGNLVIGWILIAFFFFGGIAFVAIPETREIWIGQIWIAVSLILAVIFIAVGRKQPGGGLFDSGRWSGKTGPEGPVRDSGDEA